MSVSIRVGAEPVSPGVEVARDFQYFLLTLEGLPHVLPARPCDEDFEHEVYGWSDEGHWHQNRERHGQVAGATSNRGKPFRSTLRGYPERPWRAAG